LLDCRGEFWLSSEKFAHTLAAPLPVPSLPSNVV
jgi:hypothetical protein